LTKIGRYCESYYEFVIENSASFAGFPAEIAGGKALLRFRKLAEGSRRRDHRL
jgi:hypothetical protein